MSVRNVCLMGGSSSGRMIVRLNERRVKSLEMNRGLNGLKGVEI